MQPGSGLPGCLPEFPVEFDYLPPPLLAVEERPFPDLHLQHLFEADGLAAELYPVPVFLFRPSPLVLHGMGQPETTVLAMELHQVGLAGHPQGQRANR